MKQLLGVQYKNGLSHKKLRDSGFPVFQDGGGNPYLRVSSYQVRSIDEGCLIFKQASDIFFIYKPDQIPKRLLNLIDENGEVWSV